MANTKISVFNGVKNNEISLITAFAAVGTDNNNNVGVNVKISGNALISNLESTLDLSNFTTGTLPVTRGGTGATTLTDHGILIGNAANAVSATAELADGQLLIGSTGNAPSTSTLTAGTGIIITNASGSITITNDAPNQATPAANDGSPSTGQLQYNDGSNGFAATSDMVYTTDQLKVQNTLYLDGNGANAGIVKLGCESAGATHYVGLEGPTHSGSNSYIIKFPDPDPAVGKILKVSSFSSDKAVMEWADDTSIYTSNGTLTAARTVTMGSNNLTFASTTAGQEVKFGQNVRIDGQSYTPLETISSTTSWTPDWDSGNVQTMELTAATTINNPSNIEVGATYIIILKQDGDGNHTVTWGSQYKFPGATAPNLTTGGNKADVITLIAYSSTVLMCTSVLDFETT